MSDGRSGGRSDALKKIEPIDRRIHNRKRAELAPAGFVTQRSLREKVGLSATQFRSLLAREVITSDRMNSQGYVVYSMETVERLLTMKADGTLFRDLTSDPSSVADAGNFTTRYSADEGVRVFELLDQGRSLKDVILATKIHPLLVKFIRADYDDITGSIHLPKPVVDKINALKGLPGSFPLRNAYGVLESFKLYAENRVCSGEGSTEGCTQLALNLCQDCLTRKHRLARQRAREAIIAMEENFPIDPHQVSTDAVSNEIAPTPPTSRNP